MLKSKWLEEKLQEDVVLNLVLNEENSKSVPLVKEDTEFQNLTQKVEKNDALQEDENEQRLLAQAEQVISLLEQLSSSLTVMEE